MASISGSPFQFANKLGNQLGNKKEGPKPLFIFLVPMRFKTLSLLEALNLRGLQTIRLLPLRRSCVRGG